MYICVHSWFSSIHNVHFTRLTKVDGMTLHLLQFVYYIAWIDFADKNQWVLAYPRIPETQCHHLSDAALSLAHQKSTATIRILLCSLHFWSLHFFLTGQSEKPKPDKRSHRHPSSNIFKKIQNIDACKRHHPFPEFAELLNRSLIADESARIVCSTPLRGLLALADSSKALTKALAVFLSFIEKSVKMLVVAMMSSSYWMLPFNLLSLYKMSNLL